MKMRGQKLLRQQMLYTCERGYIEFNFKDNLCLQNDANYTTQIVLISNTSIHQFLC
jgi:hypothetical protein